MDDKTQHALERFKSDTAGHKIEILHNAGLYRHLKFSNNGSSVFRFDLITWPGHLCVCGDMGTFVFQRLNDMFAFFRSEDDGLKINPSYWAEKCEAQGRKGVEEYSPEIFRARVEEWMEDAEFMEEEKEVVREDVLPFADDGEGEAMRAVMGFEFNGRTDMFQDFWEYNLKEYTFHYLWICHAIVWGIQQYDQLSEELEG